MCTRSLQKFTAVRLWQYVFKKIPNRSRNFKDLKVGVNGASLACEDKRSVCEVAQLWLGKLSAATGALGFT